MRGDISRRRGRQAGSLVLAAAAALTLWLGGASQALARAAAADSRAAAVHALPAPVHAPPPRAPVAHPAGHKIA
jgi:hypothetical protein